MCVILRMREPRNGISLLYIYNRNQLIDNYDCNLDQSCQQLLYASGVQPTEPSKVEFGWGCYF